MSSWLHHLIAGAVAMIVFCQALFGQAADYFVDAELGHDNNSGLSPAEAWQSIERVNQAQLSAGDTVHLKAGSVWRGSLMCQSGVEGRPVTYTSYGQGPKPTLLASVDLCSPDAWVPDGRNIWKTRQDRITGNEPIPSFASKDWSLYCDGEGEASMTTRTGHQGSKVYTLRCRNRGERPTNIQLNCVGIALEPGQCIRYRFRAKATHPFSITDIALIQANHPWASYGVSCRRATDITTDWQEHEVVIRTTLATPVTDGRLSFFIGSSIAEGSEFCFMPLGAELVSCDSLGLDADVGNIIFVPFDPGAANDTRVTNGSPAFAGSLARTNGRSNRATINKAELQKIAGWKRWDRASLTRQGDFYHDPDDNRLYLYSERHPAELYSQIEAAMKRVIVRFQDSTHVTVDGLTIAYTGAHGANGSYCKHGTIRNCEFLWIGGSHLFTQNGSPVRYGNGVEFWDGCEGMTVENNYFENIYDTAMTNQGRGEGEVKDMVWRDNKTFRCEQAYEIWFSNPEMKVDRLFVTGNECVDSGYGWGHVQRPNKNGCHFLAYTLKCKIGDIRYERNTLNNARDAIIWFTNSRLSEFCIDNNTYIQDGKAPDKKKLFRWLGAPAEGVTFDAYRDATGNDQESVLRASDPLNKHRSRN